MAKKIAKRKARSTKQLTDNVKEAVFNAIKKLQEDESLDLHQIKGFITDMEKYEARLKTSKNSNAVTSTKSISTQNKVSVTKRLRSATVPEIVMTTPKGENVPISKRRKSVTERKNKTTASKNLFPITECQQSSATAKPEIQKTAASRYKLSSTKILRSATNSQAIVQNPESRKMPIPTPTGLIYPLRIRKPTTVLKEILVTTATVRKAPTTRRLISSTASPKTVKPKTTLKKPPTTKRLITSTDLSKSVKTKMTLKKALTTKRLISSTALPKTVKPKTTLKTAPTTKRLISSTALPKIVKSTEKREKPPAGKRQSSVTVPPKIETVHGVDEPMNIAQWLEYATSPTKLAKSTTTRKKVPAIKRPRSASLQETESTSASKKKDNLTKDKDTANKTGKSAGKVATNSDLQQVGKTNESTDIASVMKKASASKEKPAIQVCRKTKKEHKWFIYSFVPYRFF